MIEAPNGDFHARRPHQMYSPEPESLGKETTSLPQWDIDAYKSVVGVLGIENHDAFIELMQSYANAYTFVHGMSSLEERIKYYHDIVGNTGICVNMATQLSKGTVGSIADCNALTRNFVLAVRDVVRTNSAAIIEVEGSDEDLFAVGINHYYALVTDQIGTQIVIDPSQNRIRNFQRSKYKIVKEIEIGSAEDEEQMLDFLGILRPVDATLLLKDKGLFYSYPMGKSVSGRFVSASFYATEVDQAFGMVIALQSPEGELLFDPEEVVENGLTMDGCFPSSKSLANINLVDRQEIEGMSELAMDHIKRIRTTIQPYHEILPEYERRTHAGIFESVSFSLMDS